MRRLAGIAVLLWAALPLGAQTPIPITNPSFEAPQTLVNPGSAGAWEYGAIPGWKVSGLAGLWQSSIYAALPDGAVVAFSNGGSIAQDLGIVAQANTIYTLSVYVGHRPDDQPTTYTIALNGCTFSGKSSDIPIGTFAKKTLSCPALTGNLIITLSSAGAQADFDNVSLTSTSAIVPQHISLTVKAQLLWCTLCNQALGDDVAADGSLVIAQTNGPTGAYVIRTDGSISASGIIDIAQDPLEFTLYLIDSTGSAQPGAITKLTFPRFELYSPSFTLGTWSLGVVRISHVTIPLGGLLVGGIACQLQGGCPAVRLASIDQFKLLGP